MNINEMAKEIVQTRKEKGFSTPSDIGGPNCDLMLSKLMLVTTEVAEAAEAVRGGDFANFREELADIIIRVLDISGSCFIDIEKEILNKMKKNRERPIRHGKQA